MNCIVCKNTTNFFLKKDGYSYNRCSACGLVFVYPQPSEGQLHGDVYSKKAGYQKHRKKVATKENGHIKKILNFLTHQVPRQFRAVPRSRLRGTGVSSASASRLLDVGCSNGDFLYFAKLRGFESYGVEINELTAEVAQSRGLNIKRGTLAEAHYPNIFFDAVFLGDVIEHVPNPRELLMESRRVLKNEGVLVVSTPNLDSFWARATYALYTRFNIPWSVLTPPHHLFQFSEENMKQFLTENGFKAIAVWFRRPPTLAYELGSLHLLGKFKKEKTIGGFVFMIFAFSVYTLIYGLGVVAIPFKKKDFGMILCATKTEN